MRAADALCEALKAEGVKQRVIEGAILPRTRWKPGELEGAGLAAPESTGT
ncbi:MAG: hypothetical protein ACR2OC_08805 [Solirubrobacterales bacterium]